MAKKEHLLEHAERLYVVEGASFVMIGKELKTSDKTIRSWKAEEKRKGNDWDVKRAQYRKSRATFHEDMYEFSREVLGMMRERLQGDNEIPMALASSFRTVVNALTKTKDYEAAVARAEAEAEGGAKGLTPEQARKIKKEIFGVY